MDDEGHKGPSDGASSTGAGRAGPYRTIDPDPIAGERRGTGEHTTATRRAGAPRPWTASPPPDRDPSEQTSTAVDRTAVDRTAVDRTGLDAAELAALAQLDHPDLVVTEGYLGPERRRRGAFPWVRRHTFRQRRTVVGWEIAAVAAVVALAVGGWQLAGGSSDSGAAPSRTAGAATAPVATAPTTTPTTTPVPTTTSPPTTAPPAPTTTTAPPAPTTTAPAAPAPAVSTAGLTPQQMGAEALALVRYPWQQIPGYSIQFLPISAAPSPGFYGNTTFTWGQVGGVSDLYVYSGETVDQLAGITAFEIAHAVDAAALYPDGEQAIENAIGVHPGSWAPDCDCAEQGYLSGWYAEVFSNYWSPGVGDWTGLDDLPSVAPASVVPYLNPTIP